MTLNEDYWVISGVVAFPEDDADTTAKMVHQTWGSGIKLKQMQLTRC